MYSMVLMMALSGTAATPATFGHGGCNGGCYGGGYGCSGSYGCSGGWGHGCSGSYGCSGGWGHGCSGYSYGCSGCNGGGHKLFGGLFSKFRGHGCNGCSGYACSGSYGCSGGWGHGGYGCSGSGCYGGHFSYGCYGGHGCGGYAVPAGAPAMPAPAPAPAPAPKPEGAPKVGSLTQATLIVSLPVDAKLTIDGAETASKAATRTFISPELKSGVDYVYTLKAEMVSNGQTVTAEKQVTVRAGVETRATIELPVATTAAK